MPLDRIPGPIATRTTPASTGGGGTTSSGSVTLTSTSSGSQSITTTAYGQFVKLPDATTMTKASNNFNVRNAGGYPLKVLDNASNILGYIYPGDSSMIGCADSSTAAGVWTLTNTEPLALTAKLISSTIYNLGAALHSVEVDTDRTLLLMGSAANNLYGVIYNSLTQTFGTLTLIRSSAANCIGLKIATDTVLVASCNATTGAEMVVLSISGTGITVNTAATKVLAANITSNGFRQAIAVGSSYIFLYNGTGNKMLAATVGGTTVTIGNEETLDGTTDGYAWMTAVTSSVMLAVSLTASNSMKTKPYTLTGVTFAAGTGTSTATANATSFRVLPISSGVRWIVLYRDNAGTGWAASIVSVSGTTSTVDTVTAITGTGNPFTGGGIAVDGTKAIIYSSGDGKCNIVTDSSGTASAGTAISVLVAAAAIQTIGAANNYARFMGGDTTFVSFLVVDYSGASPTLVNFVRTETVAASAFAGPGGGGTETKFDGTRWPSNFIGTISISVDYILYGSGGLRSPYIAGNAINFVIPKLVSERNISNGATAASGIGQNVCWKYESTVYNPYGMLLRYEGVT